MIPCRVPVQRAKSDLDLINVFVYTTLRPKPQGCALKVSEFKRWLAVQGVRFEEGKRHTKLYYHGRQSTLPRHGAQELGEGLRKAILKQLGLEHSAR